MHKFRCVQISTSNFFSIFKKCPVRLPIARPTTCDLRVAGCRLLFVLLSRNMRPVIGRMSQVAIRFDVARVIARPVAGFHSSRPKIRRLKLKKILIKRLVAGRRSQVTRHSLVACLVAGRKSQVARHVNERNLSRMSQVARHVKEHSQNFRIIETGLFHIKRESFVTIEAELEFIQSTGTALERKANIS
ncbi:hypothetical protein YC2023_114927 [Brassica napus]